jgi:PilZ domain
MITMTVQGRLKVQREPRRQLNNQPAWITVDDGITRRECTVLDVAPGGAKIVTDAAIDIGDRFELSLVHNHPTLQPCEVVWRRGKIYGVKFVT